MTYPFFFLPFLFDDKSNSDKRKVILGDEFVVFLFVNLFFFDIDLVNLTILEKRIDEKNNEKMREKNQYICTYNQEFWRKKGNKMT